MTQSALRFAGPVRAGLFVVLGAGIALPMVAPTRAQEGGGLRMQIGVSTGVDAVTIHEGDDEDEVSANARLTFGLSSVTRSQSLTFEASSLFEIADPSVDDAVRPSFELGYSTETRDTAFTLGLDYQLSRIETSFFDLDALEVDTDGNLVFDADDLTVDRGTRADAVLRLGLETGRTARFGTETTLTIRDRNISGVDDPDLADRRTVSLGTRLRFDLTPQATLSLSANRSEQREEDSARSETTSERMRLGLTLTPDRLWSLSAGVGYSRVEDRERATDTSDIDRGAAFDLAVTREMPNGSLSFSLDRVTSETGPRDTVSLTRALSLPRDGELSATFGLTRFDTGTSRPLLSLSFQQPTSPNGTLSLSLSQQGGTDDDTDVVRTAGSARYAHALGPRDSLSLTARLAAVDVAGDDGSDVFEAQAGISYTRALTEDWGLSAGVTHRIRHEDGAEDERRSTFSLGLSRTFEFRP